MLRSTSALLLTRLATTTIRAMAAIDSSGCAGECYADGTYQRGARLRVGRASCISARLAQRRREEVLDDPLQQRARTLRLLVAKK